MARYPNGYIPESALVTFHTGYSPGEGNWKWQLPPATYQKHLRLVALALKNTGRTLTLSNGWSGYRPYAAQVRAKAIYGRGAADPGTSSHGGYWEKQDTSAMDYGNWSYVYGGNREAFYRDVRAVGLEPGLISPQRGYPDEPWHVVDKSPYAAVTGGGSGIPGSTTNPKPIIPTEDDEMYSIMMNGNQYGITKQFITHYGNERQARITRQVSSATDELHNLGNGDGKSEAFANFVALLDGFGIPRTAVNGKGQVLNPQSGKYEANGTWSREREILAALAKK